MNVYDDEELSFYFSLMLAVGQQPKVRVRKKYRLKDKRIAFKKKLPINHCNILIVSCNLTIK
ncbi:hypothetical protein NUKP104_47010 [Klebsiella variicola]|nr:hypothetical protein NUKP104_47010 [Klebsiella variicola]